MNTQRIMITRRRKKSWLNVVDGIKPIITVINRWVCMAATFNSSHSKRWVHTFISTSYTCVFPLNHNLQLYDFDYDHYVARFTRQSHIPNFCHIYPKYRFPIYMKYRIPCQDVSESHTPSRKFFVFPNPTLYPGNTLPDPVRSRRKSPQKAKRNMISFSGIQLWTWNCFKLQQSIDQFLPLVTDILATLMWFPFKTTYSICGKEKWIKMLWFSFFLDLFFSFVSNSLSYITIPKNKAK